MDGSGADSYCNWRPQAQLISPEVGRLIYDERGECVFVYSLTVARIKARGSSETPCCGEAIDEDRSKCPNSDCGCRFPLFLHSIRNILDVGGVLGCGCSPQVYHNDVKHTVRTQWILAVP